MPPVSVSIGTDTIECEILAAQRLGTACSAGRLLVVVSTTFAVAGDPPEIPSRAATGSCRPRVEWRSRTAVSATGLSLRTCTKHTSLAVAAVDHAVRPRREWFDTSPFDAAWISSRSNASSRSDVDDVADGNFGGRALIEVVRRLGTLDVSLGRKPAVRGAVVPEPGGAVLWVTVRVCRGSCVSDSEQDRHCWRIADSPFVVEFGVEAAAATANGSPSLPGYLEQSAQFDVGSGRVTVAWCRESPRCTAGAAGFRVRPCALFTANTGAVVA